MVGFKVLSSIEGRGPAQNDWDRLAQPNSANFVAKLTVCVFVLVDHLHTER